MDIAFPVSGANISASQTLTFTLQTWCVTVGNAVVVIDQAGAVKINNLGLSLTGKERGLLLALAKAGGKIVTPRMLLDELYDGDEAQMKILNVFVCKIRDKLEEAHPDAGATLRTSWGRGYAFGEPGEVPVPLQLPSMSKAVRGRLSASVGRNVEDVGLPQPGIHARWVTARKTLLLVLVQEDVVSFEQLAACYTDLSRAEFDEWQSLYQKDGVSALRITRTQQYRQAA